MFAAVAVLVQVLFLTMRTQMPGNPSTSGLLFPTRNMSYGTAFSSTRKVQGSSSKLKRCSLVQGLVLQALQCAQNPVGG